MASRPEVLEALEQAVAAQPGNVALRLHLAELLLEAGRREEAGRHCQAVLTGDPGDLQALELAMRLVDDTAAEVVEVERPSVTLDDVGGMEQVKRRLRQSFLGPLHDPELRRLYGKSLRGGLLLWGPPGCGKTFIGRAVAGELGARFFTVGLHDVLDMWFGQSEHNLHDLFETARRNAPCVLFLDEVDALGHRRSRLEGGGRNVVAQLLAELDSVGSSNEGVFVLAATNHPWDVDTALRRPGRLDRAVLVLPPDEPARAAILRYHLRDRPVERVDVAWLARRTDGWSGADLAMLCEAAAEQALEEAMYTGRPRPIGMGDCRRALRSLRPTTAPWFATARNFVQFGNQDGIYDELLEHFRGGRRR